MGLSLGDTIGASRDSDHEGVALAQALVEAEAISSVFTEERSDISLLPRVRVDLDVGGDDQPLFVFSIYFDLDDDLAADDYPLDEIQDLTSELRARIADSSVDGWAWLVTTGTKAGAARR